MVVVVVGAQARACATVTPASMLLGMALGMLAPNKAHTPAWQLPASVAAPILADPAPAHSQPNPQIPKSADPWTFFSVADEAGEERGGGTLQLWRVSDMVHRPEEEVVAELEPYR